MLLRKAKYFIRSSELFECKVIYAVHITLLKPGGRKIGLPYARIISTFFFFGRRDTITTELVTLNKCRYLVQKRNNLKCNRTNNCIEKSKWIEKLYSKSKITFIFRMTGRNRFSISIREPSFFVCYFYRLYSQLHRMC